MNRFLLAILAHVMRSQEHNKRTDWYLAPKLLTEDPGE